MNNIRFELSEKEVGRLLSRAIEQEFGKEIADMKICLKSEAIMVPTRIAVVVTFKERAA